MKRQMTPAYQRELLFTCEDTMTYIHIIRRSARWLIVALGHQYEPEGEVYLWNDRLWSTLDVGAGSSYGSKREAAEFLASCGYREGRQ